MAVPELPGVKDTNGIMRFLREAKSELKKSDLAYQTRTYCPYNRCIYCRCPFSNSDLGN